jgi:hypothetical protein
MKKFVFFFICFFWVLAVSRVIQSLGLIQSKWWIVVPAIIGLYWIFFIRGRAAKAEESINPQASESSKYD